MYQARLMQADLAEQRANAHGDYQQLLDWAHNKDTLHTQALAAVLDTVRCGAARRGALGWGSGSEATLCVQGAPLGPPCSDAWTTPHPEHVATRA